jgi:hypothetical protein
MRRIEGNPLDKMNYFPAPFLTRCNNKIEHGACGSAASICQLAAGRIGIEHKA